MTKLELIEEIAVRADVKPSEAKRMLEATIEVIGERLQSGDYINVPPLGKFVTEQRKPRVGRNPQTGETVPIPARVAPVLRFSDEFKGRMN